MISGLRNCSGPLALLTLAASSVLLVDRWPSCSTALLVAGVSLWLSAVACLCLSLRSVPKAARNTASKVRNKHNHDPGIGWTVSRAASRLRVFAPNHLWITAAVGTALLAGPHLSSQRDVYIATAEALPAEAGQSVLCTIRGTVVALPALRRSPDPWSAPRAAAEQESTVVSIRVDAFRVQRSWITLPCVLELRVKGNATKVLSWGAEVEASGRLFLPKPADNPGQFAYDRWLRRVNIHGLFFCDHAAALAISRPSVIDPRGWISAARQDCRQAIEESFTGRSRALAYALLLGNRRQLPSEQEEAFIRGGVMHLLAISGLHVGILYLGLLRGLHLLRCRYLSAVLISLAICFLYALLTDLRPSVCRAVIFLSISVAGEFLLRRATLVHSAGITGLLLVTAAPETALDPGAWLSFLAVCGLGWSERLSRPDTLSTVNTEEASTVFRQTVATAAAWLKVQYQRMGAILLFTTPVVLNTFHVLSPTGLVLNLIMIPLTVLSVLGGFLSLACGILLPELLPAVSFIPNTGFSLMPAVVEAAEFRGVAAAYIPDLPGWYPPAAAAGIVGLGLLTGRNTCIRGACCHMAIGAAAVCAAHRVNAAETTEVCVLSVGHGNAVVIHGDDGRTFLADCGSAGKGDYAADVISHYLWNRGCSRIDGVFLSHPDADHYNALPSLLPRFNIGRVYTGSCFLQSDAPGPVDLLRMLGDARIPTSKVANGDSLTIGRDRIRCLVPDQEDSARADNERSLVLALQSGPQRVLFPGDLERKGTAELLAGPYSGEFAQAQVILSPHHGAKEANSAVFADATKPRLLINSSDKILGPAHFRAIFNNNPRVLETAQVGAIRIRLRQEPPNQPVAESWTPDGWQRHGPAGEY